MHTLEIRLFRHVQAELWRFLCSDERIKRERKNKRDELLCRGLTIDFILDSNNVGPKHKSEVSYERCRPKEGDNSAYRSIPGGSSLYVITYSDDQQG